MDGFRRQVGETHTVEGAQPRQGVVIDDQLALDAHVERATPLLELPHGQPAVGGEAQTYAVVPGEIMRRLRRRPASRAPSRVEQSEAADPGHALLDPEMVALDALLQVLGDVVERRAGQ